MKIPENLIQKYNVPVPRYTSYPPANYFYDEFKADEYVKAIEVSNNEWPENISLYIHIPFCSKMCHFCGCNTQFTRDKEKMRRYTQAVQKEILMVKALLDPSRKVSQVHWGGGTPNTLPVELIRNIMDTIHENFTFTDKPEIAIECHPAMLDETYTEQLILAGFNRFSLGIQDFKQEVLDNVNRNAPKRPVKEIVDWIRSYDNTAVNLDFIYGLPFQNKETFAETINKAVEIAPDRLVTFSYAHVPWIKKAQKILEIRGLPEADEKLEMFEAGYDILTGNGYTPIGLDHFARENDELTIALRNRKLHRNFQGYCTRETTGQVYAFGATGISQLESVYAQNEKNPDRYVELINSGKFTVEKGYRLIRNEKIIRNIITEIMCNEFVSFDEVANKFNTSDKEISKVVKFKPELFNTFVADGLLEIPEVGVFKVTDTGRFFIRNIAAQFDPNLTRSSRKFSKAL
jgi:oxygen-independent coproporphyrinogen III oxidase